jgi:hypothetical protein
MNTASGKTAAATIIGMENSVQIATAMQHPDNLDSIHQHQIKNQAR